MNTVIEATTVEQQVPEPMRIIRERRWDRVSRQYATVEVTPAMLEATRRREQYVRDFMIYGY